MFWPMKLLDLVISKGNSLIILSELTLNVGIFFKKKPMELLDLVIQILFF
jgi:hypothetical protein